MALLGRKYTCGHKEDIERNIPLEPCIYVLYCIENKFALTFFYAATRTVLLVMKREILRGRFAKNLYCTCMYVHHKIYVHTNILIIYIIITIAGHAYIDLFMQTTDSHAIPQKKQASPEQSIHAKTLCKKPQALASGRIFQHTEVVHTPILPSTTNIQSIVKANC